MLTNKDIREGSNMKRISSVSGSLSVLLAIVLLLCTSAYAQVQPKEKVFKFGVITSITGPMAMAFKSAFDATKPTQDLLNQRGGLTVNGVNYRIEIETEDDQSSPPGAVAAFNKLRQKGIKFINAPQMTGSNMAISQEAEDSKTIRVQAMHVDATQYGPKYRYNFCSYLTTYNIPPMYNYIKTNYPQIKKVAILRADDPGGISPEEITIKEAERNGIKIVAKETYRIGTEDFYPILTKVLEKKPDAIDMVICIAPWAKGIIQGAREMGFKGPIYLSCPLGDINVLNSMLDAKYAYDIFHGGPDVLSPNMLPIVKDLRKGVETSGFPFIMDSILPLQAIYPIIQVIEKAQSFDTDKFVETWEKMQMIDTVYGKGRVTGQDIIGINHALLGPIPFSRIMNGKIESGFLESQ
jgi:branched-chain amino acid transport system substrate-binding protein